MHGPTKRHHHQRLYGHIISAAGEKKYLVRVDDGSEKEFSSALLRVEKIHASLPPDVNLLMPASNEHRVDVAEVGEEMADHEDEEPLATPGQLPTEKEQPLAKNYVAIKKQALDCHHKNQK
jgi:hypothetical protein